MYVYDLCCRIVIDCMPDNHCSCLLNLINENGKYHHIEFRVKNPSKLINYHHHSTIFQKFAVLLMLWVHNQCIDGIYKGWSKMKVPYFSSRNWLPWLMWNLWYTNICVPTSELICSVEQYLHHLKIFYSNLLFEE